MSKSLILVNYEINKKEITEKYCINKDKPQMHCCGKCMLKRKLAEQEEQQKSPAYPDIKTDIQLYCTGNSFAFYPGEISQGNLISTYHILHSLLKGGGIFHPPCA